jgi:hypothetical protein
VKRTVGASDVADEITTTAVFEAQATLLPEVVGLQMLAGVVFEVAAVSRRRVLRSVMKSRQVSPTATAVALAANGRRVKKRSGESTRGEGDASAGLRNKPSVRVQPAS